MWGEEGRGGGGLDTQTCRAGPCHKHSFQRKPGQKADKPQSLFTACLRSPLMQLPHLFISTLWENKQKHGLFPHCQHIRTLPAQRGHDPTLRVRGPLSILPQLFNSSFAKLNSKALIKSESPPAHPISEWVRCPRLQHPAQLEAPLERPGVSYTEAMEVISFFSILILLKQINK